MSAPELIDTHCHLNFESYDHDRVDVLSRAHSAGVKRIIIPAIDLPSCKQALTLTAEHDEIYLAVGVHPNSCGDFDSANLEELQTLARRRRVIAIGEIGLDYHWDKCPEISPTSRARGAA